MATTLCPPTSPRDDRKRNSVVWNRSRLLPVLRLHYAVLSLSVSQYKPTCRMTRGAAVAPPTSSIGSEGKPPIERSPVRRDSTGIPGRILHLERKWQSVTPYPEVSPHFIYISLWRNKLSTMLQLMYVATLSAALCVCITPGILRVRSHSQAYGSFT